MADFIFKAIDSSTREQVTINISAASQAEAHRLVLQRGLHPVGVKEVKKATSSASIARKRIKRKDKILFTNQLATLLEAGLPLLQALESTVQQVNNKELKRITSVVVADIQAGLSFSAALAKYPRIFDGIFISLVQAGEASGTLDSALRRLAEQQEKDGDLISKIKTAMIYPIIVVLVMCLVIVFMLVVVLPQVQQFYDSFPDLELPLMTRTLVATSDILKQYWYLFIVGFGGAVFGIRAWTRSRSGKSILDRVKLQMTPFRALYSCLYMARFTRTVGTLFSSGVGLLPALTIVREGINNIYMEASVDKVIKSVQEGHEMSAALADDPNFLTLVADMVRIGEQSGKTEEMFMKAAFYYEKEVDKQIKALTTMMEPLLILVLGGVAVALVFAILSPIYGIINENVVGT